MKRLLAPLALLLILALGVSATRSATPPPPGEKTDLPDLEVALQTALLEDDRVLAYRIYQVEATLVTVANDGQWATLILDLLDPDTNQIIATEPGLAFGVRAGEQWEVILQSHPAWSDILENIPSDLLSDSAKDSWRIRFADQVVETDSPPYTGYLLPWAGGEAKFLTRSISHGIGGSMHYAFDFAQPGYPSDMFPVRAAKAGTVKYAVWTYPNGYYDGNCNHQNYLVMEHTDTTPTTYTMYLHFAEDTLPEEFRTPGAFIPQGAYIGHADDTGCSSGNHLHIQTHTDPSSYWGSSVDFIFDDVTINGGRPRTPDEAAAFPEYGAVGQWLYTSGNIAHNDTGLPSGSITSPAMGSEITASSITIQGSAADGESGLKEYQLVAFFEGTWHPISSLFSSPAFTYTWNWCSEQVPDGLVTLALDIWDNENNLAAHQGIRHLRKKADCPIQPPACTPDANQVALYTEPNYRGSCVLLGTGEVADLAAATSFSADDAESIQLGSNLLATLYTESNYQGRGETIFQSDRNLADNLVGADQLDSLRFVQQSLEPATPELIFPGDGQGFTEENSLYFYWLDAGGTADYQARVTGSASLTTSWQTQPWWSLGTLAPGTYSWQVRARNGHGQTNWSVPKSFSVQTSSTTPGSPKSVPYSEDFETADPDWIGAGLWYRSSDTPLARSGTSSWWYSDPGTNSYDTGAANAGYLTSPRIAIPPGGALARFWYRYETEGEGPNWDQRRVQISANGGEFTDLLQLGTDEPNTWLQSPWIDLGAYASQTIQLRFLFLSLDETGNSYQGWGIDDFSVTTDSPPSCNDSHEPNDSPAAARAISIGSATSGDICGPGDLDYYKFTGSQGDRIVIDIDAESLGSSLDSYIFLYADDGTSLLASHDDEILYVLRDSHLGFELPYDGEYYIKIKDWNHPGVGSSSHSYTLHLTVDNRYPQASLISPSGSGYLTGGQIEVQATGTDDLSGVSHVSFWFHDTNWAGGSWISLGEDWDGEDGWKTNFDVDAQAEGVGMALYAQVQDWAGNVRVAGIWNLGIDRTPPTTSVAPLTPVLESTAIYLEVNGADQVSGLSHLDIQVRGNPPAWQDLQTGLSPNTPGIWFIGEPGGLYDFQSRGTDVAGNVELYPADPDTITLIQSCIGPGGYEPDDTFGQATPIAVDGPIQAHNFCQPADEDWLQFDATAGEYYVIFTRPTYASTGAKIHLFAADGVTMLAEAAAPSFGEWTSLGWEAGSTGTQYVRLTHINSAVAGDAVSYDVWVTAGYRTFMPTVKD